MNDELLDYFVDCEPQDLSMELHDYLYRVFDGTFDWESQLIAIRVLIQRNILASEKVSNEIDDYKNWLTSHNGSNYWHYENECTDLMHMSVFHEAAASMSAIGMIAPTIERISRCFFTNLGSLYTSRGLPPPTNKRWTMPVKDSTSRWNCSLRLTKNGEETDFIGGFRQLAKASGLHKHISEKMMHWLDAMFYYRNRMFHDGIEWSKDNKDDFQKEIIARSWEDYFSFSTSNNDPWIFYINKEYIAKSPDLMSEFLDSLASFCKALPEELWVQYP